MSFIIFKRYYQHWLYQVFCIILKKNDYILYNWMDLIYSILNFKNRIGDNMFHDAFEFKDKSIPKTILGNAPFLAEGYFGHRSRLYQLDFDKNPQYIADIIIESYNQGVRAINLVNDANLLEAYDIACENDCKMDVVATIGKSDIDYLNPNYEVAKEVDWQDDIELFGKYDCPLMLVDEFIVDGYDWRLISKILNAINDTGALSGLITAFPCRTSDMILENMNLDLFDFYMIPLNQLSYMMDMNSFSPDVRESFRQKMLSLNKNIIASKVLAAGIQMPQDAFHFFKKLDYVDLISIGVANKKEAVDDFGLLRSL